MNPSDRSTQPSESIALCFHVVAQYLYLQQSQILRLCIFPNHPMNQVALVSLFDDLDLQARRIGPPAFSPHLSAWIQITVSDPKIPDFKSLVRFDTWSTEGEKPPGWRINQRYKYPLCAHSSTQKNQSHLPHRSKFPFLILSIARPPYHSNSHQKCIPQSIPLSC